VIAFCVCVCVCVCMCVYVYTYIHACVHAESVVASHIHVNADRFKPDSACKLELYLLFPLRRCIKVVGEERIL
jgi:hypothetical protein